MLALAIAVSVLLRSRFRRAPVAFALLAGDIGLWYLAQWLYHVWRSDLWARFTAVLAVLLPQFALHLFEAIGPNPTGGTTRLSFALAREAEVRVEIRDIAGRRVRGIDVGTLPAGRHQAAWDVRHDDGDRVRPGIYFVTLEADGKDLGVKRLTVLR